MFRIGQKVVYPTHGVGRIEAIEQKQVSGNLQAFYILRILGTDMTIMVPTGNAERVGLRQIIGAKEVPKVMEILRKKNVEISPNWNRRFKDNMERIKTGSLYEVATVLRKLVLLQRERNLSFGEKKMLENVRQLLVSEISHAVGIEEGDARSLVDRTIAKA
ncbi:MAG: CarD family transcriptional regulator [candidate division NC10 bacterium]|nr:CarD family transcriptional regulator [candidate division NC10 bacterium]